MNLKRIAFVFLCVAPVLLAAFFTYITRETLGIQAGLVFVFGAAVVSGIILWLAAESLNNRPVAKITREWEIHYDTQASNSEDTEGSSDRNK